MTPSFKIFYKKHFKELVSDISDNVALKLLRSDFIMHICMYTCVCMYIEIYVYRHTELNGMIFSEC